MTDTTQAARLRELQADMQELYDIAKTSGNDNHGLMLNLSKSIAGLTKQIKDQELHEREVIKRREAVRYAQVIGTEFARLAKNELGEDAIPILTDLADQIELIAEAELS